jgi:hypothetical protein
VCDHIPTITKNEFHTWKDLKYPGIVQKILRLFTSEDELTDREIEGDEYYFVFHLLCKMRYI